MFDGIQAMGGVDGMGMAYALYFIIVVVLGTYTLLNLFLAIAVDSISSNDELEMETDGSVHRKSTAEESEEIESLKEQTPSSSEKSTSSTESTSGEDKNSNEETKKPEQEEAPDRVVKPNHSSCFIFRKKNA